MPIHGAVRHLRRRFSRPPAALRGRLQSPQHEPQPAHPPQGRDRRERSGAVGDRVVQLRRLVGARSLGPVRHLFRRQPGFAPHPDRLRVRGPPAAQGFPADRLCRAALRRGAEARGLRAGAAPAGIPQLRLSVALGGHGQDPARRREGRGRRRRDSRAKVRDDRRSPIGCRASSKARRTSRISR